MYIYVCISYISVARRLHVTMICLISQTASHPIADTVKPPIGKARLHWISQGIAHLAQARQENPAPAPVRPAAHTHNSLFAATDGGLRRRRTLTWRQRSWRRPPSCRPLATTWPACVAQSRAARPPLRKPIYMEGLTRPFRCVSAARFLAPTQQAGVSALFLLRVDCLAAVVRHVMETPGDARLKAASRPGQRRACQRGHGASRAQVCIHLRAAPCGGRLHVHLAHCIATAGIRAAACHR